MDRFQDMANKGLDFLKSRAKETVEAQRLHSVTRDLEARRERSLLDLGHRVVAMFDLPEFDKEAVRDRVEEVLRLSEELDKARQEYEATAAELKSAVADAVSGRPQGHADAGPSQSDSAQAESGSGEPHDQSRSGAASHPSSVPKPPSYD